MKKGEFKDDLLRDRSHDIVSGYYRTLTESGDTDRKVVYIFTTGSIAELFRSFDFHIVLPEINAIQCSRRGLVVDLIREGESLGYTGDICSYVKSDLGLMTGSSRGEMPFGKIPPPDLIVITHGGCSTYIKWGEALGREFNCPVKIVDVPFVRESGQTEYDKAYVKGQIEDLIPICEEISGVKFDIDRLTEILKITHETNELWTRLLEYGKVTPAPFDGYFDAVNYMAPITIKRGSKETLEYYRLAVEEIGKRVQEKYSPVGSEKYRLVFEGSPPWPVFGKFWSMFEDWKAVAVASSYVRVVCACEGIHYGPDSPMDFLADLASQSYYNWNHGKRLEFIKEMITEYNADALIAHSVKSCRPMSIGQLDIRNYFAGDLNIPSLFLNSDIADPRFFSTEQVWNKINTFFSALKSRVERDGSRV